ncbi:hypothetical protein [Cyanobium sp. CH-040]|uniref:hypothetical protein n=1 Tax=Cyanobium sp. CH-040 TaxID=2823708 RepID=UPI0020CB9983|nr:hypothetical protein [Cyanobium sp. CH-040]MCP9928417.1 hypothetical protein [Cyanobium sp. CH-040]
MAKDEISRADELQGLGWAPEDVRRYAELWDYRHRWGAINLEPEDRAFLRRAEAALPKRPTGGKGGMKKTIQEKSHYRWLAFHLEAMRASPQEQGLAEGEQGAWPVLLEEELRLLEELQPVLGLPDTLKARDLVAVREELVAAATAGGRTLEYDFNAPLEDLRQRESSSWKPLRGEGNADGSYPVLGAEAAAEFRSRVAAELGERMRATFPSLQS